MLEDWTVDPAELARPASAPPTTWEVSLYRGDRGERETSMAALFGAMATFADHRFVLTIGNFGHFADWPGWAERQVAGLSGYVGQLFLHWAQRVSQHDVFRTDTDAIIRRAWPLPNVTIATTPIQTQAEADRVLLALLAVKAARREAVFAPREAIEIGHWLHLPPCPQHPGERAAGWGHMPCDCRPFIEQHAAAGKMGKIDAVRVRGGDARILSAHARALLDQAVAAGVPFYPEVDL